MDRFPSVFAEFRFVNKYCIPKTAVLVLNKTKNSAFSSLLVVLVAHMSVDTKAVNEEGRMYAVFPRYSRKISMPIWEI
jgi:hypothetical protein